MRTISMSAVRENNEAATFIHANVVWHETSVEEMMSTAQTHVSLQRPQRPSPQFRQRPGGDMKPGKPLAAGKCSSSDSVVPPGITSIT